MKGEKALGLKRVIYSKNPTITQVQNMAHNLRRRYRFVSLVSIDAWSGDPAGDKLKYKIYTHNQYKSYNTWQACYNAYVDLMKGRSL